MITTTNTTSIAESVLMTLTLSNLIAMQAQLHNPSAGPSLCMCQPFASFKATQQRKREREREMERSTITRSSVEDPDMQF